MTKTALTEESTITASAQALGTIPARHVQDTYLHVAQLGGRTVAVEISGDETALRRAKK